MNKEELQTSIAQINGTISNFTKLLEEANDLLGRLEKELGEAEDDIWASMTIEPGSQ